MFLLRMFIFRHWLTIFMMGCLQRSSCWWNKNRCFMFRFFFTLMLNRNFLYCTFYWCSVLLTFVQILSSIQHWYFKNQLLLFCLIILSRFRVFRNMLFDFRWDLRWFRSLIRLLRRCKRSISVFYWGQMLRHWCVLI